MPSNDYTLWEDFLKGEQYALTQIYTENIDLLYNYGLKLIPDKELVKDTIQEVFYDLIRTRSNLSSTYNIRFYLMLSLRRKLFRENRKKFLTSDFDDEVLQISFDNDSNAEQEIIVTETDNFNKSRLNNLLSKLTRKQKELLYYKFECGYEYDQICQLLSINYDSARKLLYRTLSSIRKQIL